MKILTLLLVAFLWAGCANNQPACRLPRGIPPLPKSHRTPEPSWRSFDGTRFPFSKWLPKHSLSIKAVVILIPGWDSVAEDYAPVAKGLVVQGFAVYGMELRGQRYDPVPSRRGNPTDASAWVRDVQAFTQFVAAETGSRVPIFLHGQSFGALLAIEALTGQENLPVRGVILQSPAIAMMVPKPDPVAQAAIWLFPGMRYTHLAKMDCRDLSADEVFNRRWMHSEDRVREGYTLRFVRLSLEIGAQARSDLSKVRQPMLVMRGGADEMAKKYAREGAYERFMEEELPAGAKKKPYSTGGHIITLGVSKDQAVQDIVNWVEKTISM